MHKNNWNLHSSYNKFQMEVACFNIHYVFCHALLLLLLLLLLSLCTRIINVSSGLGNTAYVQPNIKEQVLRPDLTVDKLAAIMETFVR